MLMAISHNINTYLENSKIRNKLCRWNKSTVNVFITPITAGDVDKSFMMFQVVRAIDKWNTILKSLFITVQFNQVSEPSCADIVVHWVKVGRVYEGMCKYLSVVNNSINKVSIEIGLPNQYSGKPTTDLSIYCAILHEFGHSLGLGHGVDVDDIMFVPHQKNVSEPSENDIYVLKQIYAK